jgi:hypothetical protein
MSKLEHLFRNSLRAARRPAVASTLVVLACLAHEPAWAIIDKPFLQVRASSQVEDWATEESDHFEMHEFREGPSSSILRGASHSLLFPARSANANTYAGYGVLGVSANTAIVSQPVSAMQVAGANGRAIASADFGDILHVDAPGRSGERGTLIVPWALSGAWGGGLTGPFPRTRQQQASIEWWFGVTTSFDSETGRGLLGITGVEGVFGAELALNGAGADSWHQIGYERPVIDDSTSSATIPYIWAGIQIIFGTPIQMEVSLAVEALAHASNDGIDPEDPAYLQLRSAEASGDFFHTLRWGGVQQVLDSAGRPVEGWTISADSGTDYAVVNATPVPEPATWATLLAGLLLLWLATRRASAKESEPSRGRAAYATIVASLALDCSSLQAELR